MKVAIAAGAWEDLGAIGEWIARDDPARAVGYIDELLDACAALASYPRIYPRWPHHSARVIRRFNHNDYAVFYEVRVDDIQVLAFVHGARDLGAVLDAR
jgi:plasmid stabilization system protein ParE